MRVPYLNTANHGVLIESDEAMFEKVQAAHNAGYRLEVHAIGTITTSFIYIYIYIYRYSYKSLFKVFFSREYDNGAPETVRYIYRYII